MLLLKCQILMLMSKPDIPEILSSKIFHIKRTNPCTSSMSKKDIDCPEISGIYTVEIISFILRAILTDSVDINIIFCKMQTIHNPFRIGIPFRTFPFWHMIMDFFTIQQIHPRYKLIIPKDAVLPQIIAFSRHIENVCLCQPRQLRINEYNILLRWYMIKQISSNKNHIHRMQFHVVNKI